MLDLRGSSEGFRLPCVECLRPVEPPCKHWAANGFWCCSAACAAAHTLQEDP